VCVTVCVCERESRRESVFVCSCVCVWEKARVGEEVCLSETNPVSCGYWVHAFRGRAAGCIVQRRRRRPRLVTWACTHIPAASLGTARD
jgi:hypothetical protein